MAFVLIFVALFAMSAGGVAIIRGREKLGEALALTGLAIVFVPIAPQFVLETLQGGTTDPLRGLGVFVATPVLLILALVVTWGIYIVRIITHPKK